MFVAIGIQEYITEENLAKMFRPSNVLLSCNKNIKKRTELRFSGLGRWLPIKRATIWMSFGSKVMSGVIGCLLDLRPRTASSGGLSMCIQQSQ